MSTEADEDESRKTERLTSKAFSSLDPNSASTKLSCSLPGTYALPFLMNTLRPSTNSGTRSQSTLNHSSPAPASPSRTFAQPPAPSRICCPSSLFSDSETVSQSNSKPPTNPALSRASSLCHRSRNRTLSTRANLRRNSSVAEKARRRMKWL